MLRRFFICFVVLVVNTVVAQVQSGRSFGDDSDFFESQESIKGKKKKHGKALEDEKASIEEYLIISHERDTTYLDTSLTIKKDYKVNYLRKDNFGLLPFSNLGQTYNSLTYNFENTNTMPQFGARARHFNYMEIQDINYYRVPTPLTELFYRTAFEQGQLADSFFTVNTSPQFNFSVAYKGLRSIGNYQHMITSTGNFRFTLNYTSKNKRYQARGHFVTQDLFNEENGGLQDESIVNFESGEEEFIERSILEVNFEDADNILKGKRFYLDQTYNVFNNKKEFSEASTGGALFKGKLDVRHLLSFEDKYYQYNQSGANTEIFGDAFVSRISDKTVLEHFYNELQLDYQGGILGNIQVNVNNTSYNYGYNKLVVLEGNRIVNRLKGNILAVGGKYNKRYKGFHLKGELGANVLGDFSGNYLKVNATFNLDDDISASASINHSSKAPNYNTLLYQSNYLNYNWKNNFNNVKTQQVSFKLKFKELANITVDYSTINDYVFFKQNEATLQVSPFQESESISYLRVKLENEIKFGKFAINNTVMYQNVESSNNVLNVPEINTRNTFYFSSHFFKKALFLQTGVTLNYFTKYYADGYNPLLAEFYVQNDREFGDFPRLDFFLNTKIRQTRIYFKLEHFNSSFTGYDYYSAPAYPYRDFAIRFGLVWNFFL